MSNVGNTCGGIDDHHRHADGDDHHHDHGGAGHVHAPASFGKAFAIGITLNTALVVAEAVYGYLGNSTALMADAGHNLSDIFGLLVAWAASIASKRASRLVDPRGTRERSLFAGGHRSDRVGIGPAFPRSGTGCRRPVMVVATIGIFVNGATALLFARGRKGDINIQGAFLHMASDAAVSAGVVISAALILWTGRS